ncbi:hypothetical protein D8674_008709 [Pyrus ussuriensis x Pyrus communis]|uniref:Calmodulin-binding domain-containing protein n=1 Tax=Pyrus ussuriensis x Pyrus communis TaxID=2448454 RepID=A0A5N5I0H7_9ROSA|nr:hypothetical protein D8674_008709 [Pyrus ussuriensis x Pyrus communis]
MDDKELEVAADFGSNQMPEKLSTTTIDAPSVLQNQNGRSQGEGAQELPQLHKTKKKKKLKKLTSIKLSKSPSLKPSRRRSNHHVSSTDDSCDTSTENLQNSARTLTRRSSFKPAKNLTRISSLKFRNPLMRKCSGGTQMNNIDLMKSRMSKPADSAISSTDADSSSPTCSSSSTSIETRKRAVWSKPNSKTSPGQCSPLNFATKSNKYCSRNHSEIFQVPELRVQRPTCSSALKGSKLPEIRDPEAEGTECEGGSATRVCPFTYCSLHGHRNANVPPLKRLISIRRRMLRAQRGVTRATQPLERVKRSGKNKDDQTNHMACNGNGAVHETNAMVSLPAQDCLSPEFCCIATNLESTKTDWNEEKFAVSDHNEGSLSTCTDDMSINDPTLIGKNMEVDDCATVKLPDNSERPTPHDVVESTRDNEKKEVSSASHSPASKEQIADNENQKRCAQAKEKYTRMWQLMYKHAAKGITPNVENKLPLDGSDKEEKPKDANITCDTDNSCFTETDEHTVSVNHRAGDETTEICCHDAIQLVQEAFDSILLPEIQDCSYDDQSSTSGPSSDLEALEQTIDEGGEQSTSTTSHLSETSTAQNPEEKTVSEVGVKTDKKTPKSWSSVKKFILLKRFVKAVEKVRNLNYPKREYLPLHPDSEAEKINLRQQKTEERKKAEEWMLDYALQQVISKLPQPQQKRVALLVEAFETVLPFSEVKGSQRSNETDSTKSDLQVCNGLPVQSSVHQGKGSDLESSAEILLGNVSCPEKSLNESPDQASDFQMQEQRSQVNFPKLRESSIGHCSIQTERDITVPEATGEAQKENRIVSINACDRDEKVIDFTSISSLEIKDPKLCDKTSLEQDEHGSPSCKGLVNEVVQEASKEVTLIASLELSNIGSMVENIKSDTNKLITETDEQSNSSEDQIIESHEDSTADNTVISLASIGSTEEQMAAREEVREHEARLEKKKYTNLWFLVYKHMASTIDPKDGDEPLEGAKEEQVDDANRLPEIDQEKSDYADNKKVELRHIEAIKLQVEKAIDEIVLPENQDESDDDKSSTRDSCPEQEPPKNKVVVEGKSFISKSTNFAKFDNATIQEEENPVAKVEDKPAKKMSKNWSNLKKMILLNRFIKALEKVKKFSPRGPRYLPFEPDPEAEKVHLKHLNMDDRKNSEEWMLDYALQQAVSRLTPARKRKVSLLVEAFETVIPSNGIPNPFKPQIAH